MKLRALLVLSILAASTLLAGPSAWATTERFTGQVDSPLDADFAGGTATFSGGQLLFGPFGIFNNPNFKGGIYATTSQLGGGYTNPITITFSQPVTHVSVLMYNMASTAARIDVNGVVVATNSLGTKFFSVVGPITTLTLESHNFVGNGPDLPDWDFAILGSIGSDQGEISLVATPPPAPADFSFAQIADTNTAIPDGTGNFNSAGFSSFPSAVSSDTVAFHGAGATSQSGVYTGSGGALTTVADISSAIPDGTGNFATFGSPAISGATVAFRGVGAGGQGIYTSSGGALSKVADLNSAIPDGAGNFGSFGGRVAISGSTVAFLGADSGTLRGVYTASGGSLTKVADSNTAIPDGTGNFTTFVGAAISGSTVVFEGQGVDPQGGNNFQYSICMSSGGSLIKVADKNTAIPGGTGNFIAFGGPAAISGSTVVFEAQGADPETGGSNLQRGIYMFSGGSLTKIADKNTAIPDGYSNFTGFGGTPAISGSTVVFSASGIWGQGGIYRFHGGVLSKVIGADNALDDSRAVFGVTVGSFGLDGTSVSFFAFMDDNSRGIFRATRAPECGDGVVGGTEECDDDGTTDGDGCSSSCQVEPGFECAGEPSICTPLCGNSRIDPGEDCDGTECCGNDCKFASAAGEACSDDDDACTQDVCDASGTCQHQPTPQVPGCASLPHFECHRTQLGASIGRTVSLSDQFGAMRARVNHLTRLCNPADKNGEDPDAPTRPEHLTRYAIRSLTGPVSHKTVEVSNQFGIQRFELGRPLALLVPAATDLTPPPPPPLSSGAIDHFTCYEALRVAGTRAVTRTVVLRDELGTQTFHVSRPHELCVPTDENDENPGAETHPDDLLCYVIRRTGSGLAPLTVSATDQFASGPVDLHSSKERLCVPSRQVVLVPGETQTVSGSDVSAWARIDSANTVVEVGATVPFALIQNPPTEEGAGPAGAIATVAFPAQVQDTTYFNHFELHWEPDGHPPAFTMVPHFDLHFYSIPPQEVLQVTPPDSAPPAADHIPPNYVYPGTGAVVPEMGVHARNPAEYQGVFTKVFIAGFYDGEMTFLEPAMNRTFLLQKPSYSVAVPRPAVLGRSTRYPTKFTTTYNSTTDSFTFVFSDFVPIQ